MLEPMRSSSRKTGRVLFAAALVGFAAPSLAQPMTNPHCLAFAPDFKRFIVSVTNGGSNGNGRVLKGKEYAGNYSPLHVFDL